MGLGLNFLFVLSSPKSVVGDPSLPERRGDWGHGFPLELVLECFPDKYFRGQVSRVIRGNDNKTGQPGPEGRRRVATLYQDKESKKRSEISQKILLKILASKSRGCTITPIIPSCY